MSIASLVGNITTKIGTYAQNPGRALVHLGALGWLLSSAAQISMVATNKNIDKDKKKFLMTHEAADGLTNVGLFYTICAGIKSVADKVVEGGLLAEKRTSDFITGLNRIEGKIDGKLVNKTVQSLVDGGFVDAKEAKKPMTAIFKGLEKFVKSLGDKTLSNPDKLKIFSDSFEKLATPEARQQLTEQVFGDKGIKNAFVNHKNGMGKIAAIGASVIATSIIAPIVRNKVANHFQKKLPFEQRNEVYGKYYSPLLKSPVPPVFGNRFKI